MRRARPSPRHLQRRIAFLLLMIKLIRSDLKALP